MKLTSTGRGRGYKRGRGFIESSLGFLYVADWPARLWAMVPDRCSVHVIRRTLRILPPGMPDLTIGYASDLHIGPTTPAALLDAAADALANEKLDMLWLGGDYVFLDATPAKAARLGSFVRRAGAPRTLAVLGNHDLWTDHGLLERALTHAGAELITDRAVHLTGPHEGVAVVGLDDPWTGTPDPARAFADTASSARRLVLCHSPDGLPLVSGRDVALFMCGHTHGGQVALPWGPIVVPSQVGRELYAGFHDYEGTKVFVSRGIGGIEIPIRTFARPDVAVVTLTQP